MKVFIHWDMEGVSGLFRREQVWYWEPGASERDEVEGRDLLIADVNAACSAALEAGADELIVCDTHHGGGNFVLERMLADPRITYLTRSVGYQDGQRRWMPGLDRSVDALLLPGHHAKAGATNAFLPHTWSLAWADFQINGQSVGEMGIEACFAGHWGIPLILMQGDAAACAEAREQFPGVVTAEVKRALSHDRATGPDAETARQLTSRKITEAIARARTDRPRPFKPSLPLTVTIRMTTVEAAETASTRTGVRRVDDYTVAGQVSEQSDVVKWINGTGLAMSEQR